MTGILPLTIGGEPLPDASAYSVATMLAGGQQRGTNLRREADFYPTPRNATLAFLRAEEAFSYLSAYQGPILEPCCGEGHMSRVMAEFLGCEVISTDLRPDSGFGVGGVDFPGTEALPPGVRRIITNPPYGDDPNGVPLPVRFAFHALEVLKVPYLAMLLKQTFWNAGNRRTLWRLLPPSRQYQTTFRVDFTGGGASTVGGLWVVWDRASGGTKRFELIDEDGLVR
jgi:hypothetical protein